MVLQPFPWYGSKILKQDFIQSKLPLSDIFVVPFGGSGSIMLNREPVGLEVFNDIDSGVVNFFKVLRDNPEELVDRLDKTPYHESIFEESKHLLKTDCEGMDKAIAFFVVTTMSYNSTNSSFAYSTKEIRRNRSQSVSRYQSKIDELERISTRLSRIQFFNRSAIEIIEKFQREGTLMYLDPPYPGEVRSSIGAYSNEMSEDEHIEMLDIIKDSNVRIAISTYENDLYNDYLKDWFVYRDKERGTGATNSGSRKQEILMTNYDVGLPSYSSSPIEFPDF